MAYHAPTPRPPGRSRRSITFRCRSKRARRSASWARADAERRRRAGFSPLLRPSGGRLLSKAPMSGRKRKGSGALSACGPARPSGPVRVAEPNSHDRPTLAPPLAKHRRPRTSRASRDDLAPLACRPHPAGISFSISAPTLWRPTPACIHRARTHGGSRVIVAREAVSMVDVSIRISLLDLLQTSRPNSM